MSLLGTGVLGGGGRIPLSKAEEYGFDGRVTPRLFHKPHLGPKRPRLRRPFHLGPATLRGDNMRGLTAKQINGNVQFMKLEKVSPLEAKVAYHIERHAHHLAEMTKAMKAGNEVTKRQHMKMADTHAAIVHELADNPKENFGKFDEWMGDDVLEKADKKKKNNELRNLGITAGAYGAGGAGLYYYGKYKAPKLAHERGMRELVTADEYHSGVRTPKYPRDNHNNIEMAPHKKAEFKRQLIEQHDANAEKAFNDAHIGQEKWNKTIPGRAIRGVKFGIKAIKNIAKSDGELNSIARKSLSELAKDMYSSGMQSAATGVFDRAFGVQGSPNPQPVAHVNPGNHFASGWHWANGNPPAAPVASL